MIKVVRDVSIWSLAIILLLALSVFNYNVVNAQTDDSSADEVDLQQEDVVNEAELDEVELVEDDAELEVLEEESFEEEILEGIEVSEPETVPSRFGMFWRGIRESVSLITTFNPVKKAEKQLKFAEERIRIAEKISENINNPEAQARAEKMIEKANVFIQRIDEKKDRWIKNGNDNAKRLMRNIATHNLRRQRILDRVEEKLPEDKRERFEELRENHVKKARRIMSALKDEDLPDDVREHLLNAKERFEKHSEASKEFREKRLELVKSAKDGDETAKDELTQLRDKKKQRLHEIKSNFKIKKHNLKKLAEQGDEDAIKRLEQIENTKEKFKVKVEERREYRERRHELINSAKEGDVDAKEKLRNLNNKRKDSVREFKKSVRERVDEMKERRKDKFIEEKKDGQIKKKVIEKKQDIRVRNQQIKKKVIEKKLDLQKKNQQIKKNIIENPQKMQLQLEN